MFAQIIRGRTSDPMAVRACLDRWMADLAPTATGWLDTTSGVTDEGDFFALVRFDSEEAATATISKPEHDRWWTQLEEALDGGGPNIQETSDLFFESRGDFASARFIQVRMLQFNDLQRPMELFHSSLPARAAARPDVLGTLNAACPNGYGVTLMYFRSEEAAREGEHRELSADVKEFLAELRSLAVGPGERLDLRTPWHDTPNQ